MMLDEVQPTISKRSTKIDQVLKKSQAESLIYSMRETDTQNLPKNDGQSSTCLLQVLAKTNQVLNKYEGKSLIY
jgi:hypothetical protein